MSFQTVLLLLIAGYFYRGRNLNFANNLGLNTVTESLNIYHPICSLIYPQPLRPQMEIPELLKKQGSVLPFPNGHWESSLKPR